MIIAVAMVRDEADILPLTIPNLWEQGVDRILVADNMSVDGSGDLCADYGCDVTLDTEVGYEQARKMTGLARRAYDAGAKWVLPFDADELWLGLANLTGCPYKVVETWPHVFVGELDKGPETFPKVCFKADPYARIEMGNHGVQRAGERGNAGLEVRHYQYRSLEQVRRKVRNGVEAYNATTLPSYYGAHWRTLAEMTDEQLEAWWADYTAGIAAVVVSLPERHDLLVEALASVHAQTLPVDDIIVGIDPYRLGEVANMNRLLRAVDTEWVAFLHDDDLWHDDHLAVCSQEFPTADVVVSRFDLIGRPWNTIEPWHDNFADLRWTNWIGSPSMVVARRSTFGEWVGKRGRYCWNDWSQWNHLLDKGARFADTRCRTVDYRFGPWSNGSWSG